MNRRSRILFPRPNHDGRIIRYPVIVATYAEDDRWSVVCTSCGRKNTHSSAAGHRAAHCGCDGGYVIAPPWASSQPYPSVCRQCRTYFVEVGDDPDWLGSLRFKSYTPVNVEYAGGSFTAFYECNFEHSWTAAWDDRPPVSVPPILSPRCVLYRHFDEDGILLYVGISETPTTRGTSHARYSGWTQFASRLEGVWLDTRAEAETAERIAIAAELPIFNVVHAGPDRDARVEAYLRSKGCLDGDQ